MKKLRLEDSGARGWFVGDFDNAAIRTKDFEVCWQFNAKGTPIASHYHRTITELQLVTNGLMNINGIQFGVGDICVLEPGEEYHAQILEDTHVVAIKFPSIPSDKYYL
jgi:hypothetical protein